MQIAANPYEFSLFRLGHTSLSASLLSHFKTLSASPTSIDAVETKVSSTLAQAISNMSLAAYNKAAADVDASPEVQTRFDLQKLATDRAKLSASLMMMASKPALGISASIPKMHVASVQRSARAASYELRLAYFLGTQRGWELDKKSKKIWLLASSHDKDDSCDDNADQDAISIFDFFDSGVMYPPAHINCTCYMALVKQMKKGTMMPNRIGRRAA